MSDFDARGNMEENDDGTEVVLRALLQLLLLTIITKQPKARRRCLKRKRLDWEYRASLLEETNRFERCYKMPRRAFDALLALLEPFLAVDTRKSTNRTGIEPVTPANKLRMFLRFMSGGSCHDIIAYSGVAESTFYDCVHEVADLITTHPDLQIKFPDDEESQQRVMQGFQGISNGGAMKGCVGAIDGWLCQIQVPSNAEVDKVRPFYSGHYRCYGVNVQACCDHLSRITAVSISCPGGTGDAAAYREWGLAEIVRKLPMGRYLVGDNVYTNENTLLTPFPRPSITNAYRDSFNFHLSLLRIRIEMAFGLLVRKWRIFRIPLQVKFKHVSKIILAGCVLLNWCINQRIADDPTYDVAQDEVLADAVSELEDRTRRGDNSTYRELYRSVEVEARHRQLFESNKKCPRYNTIRRARADALQ